MARPGSSRRTLAHRLHRRRPGRPVFLDPDEEGESAARDITRRRAQPARRHLRLGRRVLRRDAGQLSRGRSRDRTPRSRRSFHHWDDIDVSLPRTKITSGGHGFCGIGRKRLLNILQERAAKRWASNSVFETDVPDDIARLATSAPISSSRPTASTARSARAIAEHVQPGRRRAQVPLHLARHEAAVRRVHVRVRRDRPRLVPGARLPVRRRHHRRSSSKRPRTSGTGPGSSK